LSALAVKGEKKIGQKLQSEKANMAEPPQFGGEMVTGKELRGGKRRGMGAI